MSKLILDEKDVIDTSVIIPGEYFIYLGKTFVKKMNHDFKKSVNPQTGQEEYVFEKKVLPDGHMVNTIQVPDREWEEFFELEIVKTDSPDVLEKFGRPLTTQIIPHGPKEAKDIFKYEGETIRYKNRDLKTLSLTRKGSKIVLLEGTPEKDYERNKR